MSTAAPPVPTQFFGALGLVLLLLISLGLALVFAASSYADIEHLRHVRYHDSTFRYLTIPLQPAGYALSKALLLALLGSLVGVASWQLRRAGWLYQELRALQLEWRTSPSLLTPWRRLHPVERRTALGLLGVLLLVRGYYVVNFPLYGDELVTYLSFVREGVVAATSFYPIPNNHILYSLLCWLSSRGSENFYWTMRGPTFVVSTAGTLLVALLLLRRLPFRVVALAVGLFSFFPYALFQSVVGRGYFLLAVCSQLAFMAGQALGYGTTRPRLAWTALVVASVAGFYAIPTFLLFFSGLVLGLAFAFRRQLRQLLHLGAAGALVALATLLLYAPVVLVSGPAALLGNAYVAPGTGQTPDLNSLTYPAFTEGQLLGVGAAALPLVLALSMCVLLVPCSWFSKFRHSQLWWVLLLSVLWTPYMVLAVRGVYPPARVLSFRMFFVFLLGALLFDTLLQRWSVWWQNVFLTVALPVLLWAIVVLVPFQRRANLEATRNARVAQTYAWLRQQQAHTVLATHPHYQLYLLLFSKAAHRPLVLDASPKAGTRYDFQLLDKEAGEVPTTPTPVLFENPDILIHEGPQP